MRARDSLTANSVSPGCIWVGRVIPVAKVPLHFAGFWLKVPLHFAEFLVQVPLHFALGYLNCIDNEGVVGYYSFWR